MTTKDLIDKLFEDCGHMSPYCENCAAEAVQQAVDAAYEDAANFVERLVTIENVTLRERIAAAIRARKGEQ